VVDDVELAGVGHPGRAEHGAFDGAPPAAERDVRGGRAARIVTLEIGK
jgi:hypothetical protein